MQIETETANFLVWCLSIYGLVGICIAIVFLAVGIGRVDANARGNYAFRPILLPGIIVLWPLVLARWYILERQQRVEMQP